MDDIISIISKYFHEQQLGKKDKEEVKKSRFLQLLMRLFPEENDAISKYVSGHETSICIKHKSGTGSIDAFYGNLIIEFERDLLSKNKFDEGSIQLKEYVSGLWNEEGSNRRNYICILSDGISWNTYYPSINSKKAYLGPEDIDLKHKESIVLNQNDDTLFNRFYEFIDRHFFRDTRLKPSIDSFKRDFGTESYLYEKIYSDLDDTYSEFESSTEVKTAFSQWARYLTYTYGSLDANRGLFIKHSYLSVLARCIIAEALFPDDTSNGSIDLLNDLLSGIFFERKRILNLVDNDFFHWLSNEKVVKQMEKSWLSMLSQLKTYDLSHIGEDILKGLYQELVDPKDRHDLGEYYTPDWLCEKIIRCLFKSRKAKLSKGVFPSFLDPTCGSGSFIRQAIHVMREIVEESFGAHIDHDVFLSNIVNNVIGIDIHPLAVIISKANYILSLKDIIPSAKKSISIPIYLADSLFMPQKEKDDVNMFDTTESTTIISFQNKNYRFPTSVFSSTSLYDKLIILAAEFAESMASDPTIESLDGMNNSLRRNISELSKNDLDLAAGSLFMLSKHLAEKIRNHEDSIWSFILRNSYRPLLFRKNFDIIAGNPPWLSYRYISDPSYQAEIKQLAIEVYKLAPRKQKLMTQMELASIFFVNVTNVYLKKDGLLAFVMPRSIFNGDQHDIFRKELWDAECDVTAYWDLKDVSPLFNVPSCVIFSRNHKPIHDKSYSCVFIEGSLPSRDITLDSASSFLKEKKGKLYLASLGARSALSTTKKVGLSIDTVIKSNYYMDHFFQGATIVPRNFYFITTPNKQELASAEFCARTDPEQAKDGKMPWKEIFLENIVETDFLFHTALSKHILPFYISEDLPYVLLPVLKQGGSYNMQSSKELRLLGFRKTADWFFNAETEWNNKRSAKSNNMTLYAWLDYQKKLSNQNPLSQWIILYNASGTNISCAVLQLSKLDKPFYADAKTYWSAPQSKKEAFYLCGIFNSSIINILIKPFQSAGSLGERDIHKTLLEVPYPQFDSKNDLHCKIAQTAESASAKVTESYHLGKIQGSLAKQRSGARQIIQAEINVLNKLVDELIK